MPGDYARSVQILIELAGNPEQRLTEINKLVDQVNGKKITLTDSMAQVSGASNNAVDSLKKVSNSTQDVARNANDLSSKGVSAFDKIRSSVGQLNDGVQNLAASLAGIAMGSAISGLTWKASADYKLYNEQIDKAINANKKLKISSEEFDEFVKAQAEAGEGTRQDTKKELYSVLNVGSKYLKGNASEKLNKADAITDFWFANQEMMKAQGFNSPEEMVLRALRSSGKMEGVFGNKFATALGVDPSGKEMSSAKNRLNFMIEQGSVVNMKKEMDKRPWEDLLVSVTKLKYAIGDSLAPAMSGIIKLLTGAVKLFNMIPGGSLFIGLAGGAMALVSTLTLLNAVIMPGVALLKQLILLTNMQTLAQARALVVSKALIVTDWLGVTSLGARTVATTGLTGATIGLAAAEWAALSPLLLIGAPLIAVAGLLYLVESRTHVFSNALKQLSETEMSRDISQWFKDVGYWVGYAVDKIGGVIGTDLSNKISGLNSLYKMVKSGAGGGEMKLNLLVALGPLGLVLKSALPLITGYLELISDSISYLKNLLDSGWKTISGIYNSIVTLPQKLSTFITTGISTLMSKIPGFGGEGKSEEGFIEFIRSAKKGDSNYDKYAQLSDEALRAAYREAQTGIPQDHPNMHDEYEYDNIVKNGYAEYMKSSPTIINNVNNVSLVGAADKVLQEDIAEVNRKLENGEPVSRLSTDMGNPSGLLKTAYNYFFGDGFANGGYVKRSGLALVHTGEPIIPADVANSSRLQNILENIAYGGSSSTSTVNNQPIIQIEYKVDPKSGVMFDKIAFEHMVSDIVAKKLRQLNGY